MPRNDKGRTPDWSDVEVKAVRLITSHQKNFVELLNKFRSWNFFPYIKIISTSTSILNTSPSPTNLPWRVSAVKMAARRIAKELKEVTENPIPGGGLFILSVNLPKDYPFKPPVVNFVTRIYHPNVTYDEKGSICVDELKQDKWKPSGKITAILGAIRNLLIHPNPDDPLENAIAEKCKTDPEGFAQDARENTNKGGGGECCKIPERKRYEVIIDDVMNDSSFTSETHDIGVQGP
ncbi:hypothetical protein EYC84_010489 [Monilinia fructicola]|uniref:UBC core domain-containing protein n=1 Tax=Monilinia fructicola TaxID=38448 RepID=A0A5M9JFF8_MONFR|nr:hypothetical protein EYC84_010489 [Monilinia fructicola]